MGQYLSKNSSNWSAQFLDIYGLDWFMVLFQLFKWCIAFFFINVHFDRATSEIMRKIKFKAYY